MICTAVSVLNSSVLRIWYTVVPGLALIAVLYRQIKVPQLVTFFASGFLHVLELELLFIFFYDVRSWVTTVATAYRCFFFFIYLNEWI